MAGYTATYPTVYPEASGTTTSAPAAPTGVTAVAGANSATVSFTPQGDGGSPITSFTATSSPGGVTASGPASPLLVEGLTNGTAYTFTVTATNSVGTSPASSPSAAVTPAATVAATGLRRIVKVQRDGVWKVIDLLRAAVPATTKPGPTNTGVQGNYAGLTASGSVNITVEGTVLDGLDILGPVTVRADNVTIRNCRIRAEQYAKQTYSIAWANVSGLNRPPQGLILEDCEIDGNGVDNTVDAEPYPTGWGMSASLQVGIGYTMRRCDVHGLTDGIKPQDNPAGTSILIEDCWVHDLNSYYISANNITHNDILQIAGSGAHDVLIRRNFFDGYRPSDPNIQSRYASSSLIQWGSFPNASGVLRNVILEDNWIEGGGIATRLNAVGVAVCENVHVRNNRLGLHHRFNSITGTTSSADGGTIQAAGNVWDVSGTTDYGLVVIAGQAV